VWEHVLRTESTASRSTIWATEDGIGIEPRILESAAQTPPWVAQFIVRSCSGARLVAREREGVRCEFVVFSRPWCLYVRELVVL